MAKSIRWFFAALLTIVVLPTVATIFQELAKQVGWGDVVSAALGWLAQYAGATWYAYAVIAVVAFGFGLLLDWLARKMDSDKQLEYRAFAAELEDMRQRFLAVVHWHQEEGIFDSRGMFDLSIDFVALKVSLQKAGIPTPKKEWVLDANGTFETATPYLTDSLAFLSTAAPLLKRGHIREVRALRKELDLR